MLVLHRSVEASFPEETNLNQLMRLGRDDRVTRYVKLLLQGMVVRGESVVVLEADQPMPPATHFGQQLPRFDLVADAIKKLASLDPVPSATPREGVIDLDVIVGPQQSRRYRVFARFVDAPQRTVYLHLSPVK